MAIEEDLKNVKIKKIKKILLDKPVSVYDITVPETHNFLLKSNIFVHNCCQVIYKIFTNPVQTNIMDLANSIHKSQGTLTTQAKPLMYNTPKRTMSQRQMMQKALSLFDSKR